MRTLTSICRLWLLLFVAKAVAQDPGYRTPDGNEQRPRRKPKWSHFFVMREPRSQEKDQAEGFFYQVGSGPPIVNRLKSSSAGYQGQTENRERYNPVLHSPYLNRPQTHQQFGSRVPGNFGARMESPGAIGGEPQVPNPAGGTSNPESLQGFQGGVHDITKQSEIVAENDNANALLQLTPDNLEDSAPKAPPKEFQTSVEGGPQNSEGSVSATMGPRGYGKRRPFPSHLTPIGRPAIVTLDQFSVSVNAPDEKTANVNEQESLPPSIARHIPTKTAGAPAVLDQGLPVSHSFGLRLTGPAHNAKPFQGSQLLGAVADSPQAQMPPELSKDLSELGEKTESGIARSDVPLHQSQRDSAPFLDPKPENYNPQSNLARDLPLRNLQEKQHLPEIRKQSEIGDWQSQSRMNFPVQDGATEILHEGPQVDYGIRPDTHREREFTNHGYSRREPYQTHPDKETASPHLLPQKYNYLPISQQHAQGRNTYNPPNHVNFNTNIHVHAGSPAPPVADLQQEKERQSSHALSVHPFTIQRPESAVDHSTPQKDKQSSRLFNERIPLNQIYFVRPSSAAEVPLIIAENPNGPYRQDSGGHYNGQTSTRTARPSHLTAIVPLSLGHAKENVGQRMSPNIYTPTSNQGTNPELLLRSQPQNSASPSVSPEINTATHSIRLLLPPRQSSQFSGIPVQSDGHHVFGVPNRFQTHQLNLLPNSHGYVQTQVQLPPFSFRFRLTPIKEEPNGSFVDYANIQKIAQPSPALDGNIANLQPIPYQYQLPLQPIAIHGTHQVLFPKFPNLEKPIVPSEEGQVSISKSAEAPADIEEKSKPISGPPSVENATLPNVISVRTEGTLNKPEDTLLKLVAIDQNKRDEKTTITARKTSVVKLFSSVEYSDEKNVTLPNDLPVRTEVTLNKTEEKLDTIDETKTDEKPTITARKTSDVELFSNVVHSDEKDEANITTENGSAGEVMTETQFSTGKPDSRSISVMIFTETPKTEIKLEDEEKGVTIRADFDSSSFSIDAETSSSNTADEISTTATVQAEDGISNTEGITDIDAISTSILPGVTNREGLTVSNAITDSSINIVSENLSTELESTDNSVSSVSGTGSGTHITTENSPASSQDLFTSTGTVAEIDDILFIRTEMGVEIVTERPGASSEDENSTVSASTVTLSPDTTENFAAGSVSFEITTAAVEASTTTEAGNVGLAANKADPDVESTTSERENLETTLTTPSDDGIRQSSVGVSTTQSSATDSATTIVEEDVSAPETSFTVTNNTDTVNEIEQFSTSSTLQPSSGRAQEVPVTTRSSEGKLNVNSVISVFTFTEAPAGKKKTGKTRVKVQGLEPEEVSESNGESVDTRAGSGRTTVKTAVPKDSEISVNDIGVALTTPGVSEGETEFFLDAISEDLNETNTEWKRNVSKSSENHTVLAFEKKSVLHSTEEKSDSSVLSATSNASVSEDDSVHKSSGKELEESLGGETPTITPVSEAEQDQNRSDVISESRSDSSEVVRETAGVSADKDKNDNQTMVIEGDISSRHAKEDNSDAEVHSDSEFNKGNIGPVTAEPQNTSSPDSGDDGGVLISDSETVSGDVTADSKASGSSVLESTLNDEVTDSFSFDDDTSHNLNRSKEITVMTMEDEAFHLLINDLVTPRNITVIAPVTSTSTSVLMEILSVSEQTGNAPQVTDGEPRSGTASDEGTSVTAVANPVDDEKLPESGSGSSFFSKVFEKSLSPSHDEGQKSSEFSDSETKTRASESGQVGGPVPAKSGDSASEHSSARLRVLENFDRGEEDASDFIEISKQHSG